MACLYYEICFVIKLLSMSFVIQSGFVRYSMLMADWIQHADWLVFFSASVKIKLESHKARLFKNTFMLPTFCAKLNHDLLLEIV